MSERNALGYRRREAAPVNLNTHWCLPALIRRGGFTLIELVCVVAILATLAAVAFPAYSQLQEASAQKVAMANARTNYSIGRANDAVSLLDPDADMENYLGELGEDSWDGKEATWRGKINGKTYEATYGGDDK